jgi:anti-sigma regulatory factor (Ser/Thr protein kinase)
VEHFHHDALVYRGQDEFLAGTLPFVREGVAAGEAVLVAVDPHKAELMRAQLNGEADAVQFVDMPEIGRNPSCIIPVWRDFVAEHPAARGIGEPIWPERTSDELVECQRHEWLVNLAFADGPPWRLLCPYDASTLPPGVLDAAQMTHPCVVEGGHARASDSYLGPEAGPDPFMGPLIAPATEPVTLDFGLDGLPDVRRLVSREAERAGLGDLRTGDLLVAVNELATNSVIHAGGRGSLSVWRENGLLLCEVRDHGVLEDPLVGRERPDPAWTSGRGIWITNQLCDLSQIRSLPDGNVVRVQMSLS